MGDINERSRELIEQSPDGICVSDDGLVVLCNPAALRLFGVSTADNLIGKPLLDRFHPSSHAMLRERIGAWLAGSDAPVDATPIDATPIEATPIDATIVRRDGDLHVAIAGARLGDSDRILQITMRDITERRRAETALRESEERLTLAFAGAQEGVWDWNLETNAVFYSPRWKQMLGYDENQIEPHISAWERLVHPDDRVRAARADEKLAGGARTYEAEFRLRHKDGHYVHVLSRGFPIRRDPNGPVVRIVGTHFDLSERKRAEAALRESEERLTLAFAGAQEGVWDWNLETDAVVYSARWKQMLGYDDDEIEPHVSAWARLLHPDDRPRAEAVNTAVKRGATTYEGEFRLRHKDGHYVPVLSRGYPVRRDPDGPAVRIVGTHFDLTERKRAEAERTRTELLARLIFAQEDERRRIAREMHDQFGEQLTALSARIAALKDVCAGRPDLRSHVDALDAISRQLDRDVDHLVWDLRPTALDDLGLRAALANYVQDWSKRVGIPAELHTSGLLDERLAPDAETALYRIAQEAMTNVAKHSRARRVEVILERRPDHVMLIVEDDGVGFDAGNQDAGNEEPGDRGFGLLGMRERAALVGATLEIESSSGRGTTILVRMAVGAGELHHA